jgi:hypothetical protein
VNPLNSEYKENRSQEPEYRILALASCLLFYSNPKCHFRSSETGLAAGGFISKCGDDPLDSGSQVNPVDDENKEFRTPYSDSCLLYSVVCSKTV